MKTEKNTGIEEEEFMDFDPCYDECLTCGGEGFVEYSDHPETWDEDCPSLENHLTTCRNCGGSGKGKDCKYG